MSGAPARSVITCDLEGRIETFDDGAQALFGYTADEVVGKRRVSMFSPGLVVLGHVERWLEGARTAGRFTTRTIFIRKDGSAFAARIQITPTYRGSGGEKRHVGYCGMTEALPDVPVEAAMPPIGMGTRLLRWIVITRAPFLTATLTPMLVAAAWCGWRAGPEPLAWGLFGFALLAAAAMHVSANTFNDYFDWTSGTDQLNADYFSPFSGGSRSIELGLIDEGRLLRLAIASLLAGALLALPVLAARGAGILAFGAAGAFLAYFYTAPPLRLAARRGLGELAVAAAFGPLLTAGTVFAVTGEAGSPAYAIGVPVGLLTAAILLINEFPDTRADALAGKNHLVVTLGRPRARWLYAGLLATAFAAAAAMIGAGVLPVGAAAMLLAAPLAVRAVRVLFAHYRDRELVAANAATIKLQLLAGLAMAGGIAASRVLGA